MYAASRERPASCTVLLFLYCPLTTCRRLKNERFPWRCACGCRAQAFGLPNSHDCGDRECGPASCERLYRRIEQCRTGQGGLLCRRGAWQQRDLIRSMQLLGPCQYIVRVCCDISQHTLTHSQQELDPWAGHKGCTGRCEREGGGGRMESAERRSASASRNAAFKACRAAQGVTRAVIQGSRKAGARRAQSGAARAHRETLHSKPAAPPKT